MNKITKFRANLKYEKIRGIYDCGAVGIRRMCAYFSEMADLSSIFVKLSFGQICKKGESFSRGIPFKGPGHSHGPHFFNLTGVFVKIIIDY